MDFPDSPVKPTIHLGIFFNSGELFSLALSKDLHTQWCTSGEYFVGWKIKEYIHIWMLSPWTLFRFLSRTASMHKHLSTRRCIHQNLNEAWLLQVAVTSRPDNLFRGHQGGLGLQRLPQDQDRQMPIWGPRGRRRQRGRGRSGRRRRRRRGGCRCLRGERQRPAECRRGGRRRRRRVACSSCTGPKPCREGGGTGC